MLRRCKLHRTFILITAALCAGAFMLIGCEREPEAPAARDTPPPAKEKTEYEGTIVAMGDSLTEGYGVPEEAAYPALLEEKLQAEGFSFQVINAGISGETSSGTRSRTEWMLNLNPDIVILETGANDGLRGIDPEVTRKNIAEIIRILQKNEVVVVLAGMRMVRNLGREYTDAFAAIYPTLAEKFDVAFIPFFLEGVAGNPALNQEDSIHPNAEGYRVLVDRIYPEVAKAVREWRSRSSA